MIHNDWYAKASSVWPLLTAAAQRRETLTSDDIETEISLNALLVGHALRPIRDYCLDHKLPPLTCLVVRQEVDIFWDGVLGDVDNRESLQAEVFDYVWAGAANPFLTSSTSDTPPSRKTLVLFWNPSKFPWDRLANDLAFFDRDGFVDMSWSWEEPERMHPGDRVFLVRLGPQPPHGIVASGTVARDVLVDEHQDARNRASTRLVTIRFDALVDPMSEGVLPISQLENGLAPAAEWNPKASGLSVTRSVAAELEILWRVHLDAVGVVPGLQCGDAIRASYANASPQRIISTVYERDPKARQVCIARHGRNCCVCGFNFEAHFGALGAGFLQVHHVGPLPGDAYAWDDFLAQDLRPVCANCHAMLHRPASVLTPERLRELKDSAD